MKGLYFVFLLLGVFGLLTGCGEMDKAQFALHQEQHNNITTFGAVSTAYADAADDMAGKKHALQRDIIDRVDAAWKRDHTNEHGQIVASAAELDTWLGQRDTALSELAKSRETWSRVGQAFRKAISDLVAVSDVIAAKDVDVQKAKEQMHETSKAILNVITSAGVGISMGALIP